MRNNFLFHIITMDQNFARSLDFIIKYKTFRLKFYAQNYFRIIDN